LRVIPCARTESITRMSLRHGAKAVFLLCQQVITTSFSMAVASEHGQLALNLIQAGARAHQVRFTGKPNPEWPRMWVAEGCDGSTANLQHAVRLLALHGIDGGDPDVNRELLAYKSVPGMKKEHKAERAANRTLVFKSILHRDMASTTSRAMINMGTLAVYVTRRNHLDQIVCMIRDCFLNTATKSTVYGFAVKSNGKPSNLCFKRRSKKGTVDKAKLRVFEPVPSGMHNRSFLAENLQKTEDRVKDGKERLKKAGYHAPFIASEDLMAFEAGGEKNQKTSLKAWTQLLKAWGVSAKNNVLKEYLASKAHTWSPQRQQGSIYNYQEVADELKKLRREDLLRSE